MNQPKHVSACCCSMQALAFRNSISLPQVMFDLGAAPKYVPPASWSRVVSMGGSEGSSDQRSDLDLSAFRLCLCVSLPAEKGMNTCQHLQSKWSYLGSMSGLKEIHGTFILAICLQLGSRASFAVHSSRMISQCCMQSSVGFFDTGSIVAPLPVLDAYQKRLPYSFL